MSKGNTTAADDSGINQRDVRYPDIHAEACRIGPITERFISGKGYQHIDTRQAGDKPTRVAKLGLDRSHNRDYKVAYASDPVLFVMGGLGDTHDTIRETCEANGLDVSDFRKVEIPTGQDEWRAAFASTASTTADRRNHLKRFKKRLKAQAVDERFYTESDDYAVAPIPIDGGPD